MTHWADVAAAELLEARGTEALNFATAITPSGPIHVGNMREVLTSEAIYRACIQQGGDATFIYIADDYDPLRKVYPFLDAAYEPHVGKPLREIPCPDDAGKPNGCGKHDNYAAHFLAPFLKNLEALGIDPVVMSAYDMYHDGKFVESTIKAFDASAKVREIIERVSKRQLPKRWAPFNPQCQSCGKISGVEVTLYEFPHIHYECKDGHDGKVDVHKGGIGKLPWRLDWPARWAFLPVKFEAFGKDHGAAGGSWDTGVELVKEIFGSQAPEHLVYEFLNLKGQGAMHSSSGLAISATDVLSMTPPEVLRYLLMRQSPRKHIDFDPGLGVLSLVDEFDRMERVRFGAEENPGTFTEVERTYELSCPRLPPGTLPNKVPYRHLVTVAQMASSIEDVEAILRRSGELQGELSGDDRKELADRVEHVRFWLAHFAPDGVKFEVQPERPDILDDADEGALAAIHAALSASPWTAQAIHDSIHAATTAAEISQGAAFRAVYRAILGQDRGPRAGFFLASLDREFVLTRLAR